MAATVAPLSRLRRPFGRPAERGPTTVRDGLRRPAASAGATKIGRGDLMFFQQFVQRLAG